MGNFQDALKEDIGPRWSLIVGIILVLLAVYIIAGLFLGLWPFSSAAGVVQKVTSAESIIANYQWFYDQKAAIDAQRINWTNMDITAPERSSMLMILNGAIAEYNSRSKQITRNLWKASDLPYSIPFEVNK